MGADNRKHARHKLRSTIQIQMIDGSVASGALFDISPSGARLEISPSRTLPDRFVLKLSQQLSRWARIVWRSGDEIGVKFVKGPESAAADTKKRRVLFKCPRTNLTVPTGIALSTDDDLDMVAAVRRFSHCPHCNLSHGWLASEAFLEMPKN
jgi:hypothetical protein